MHDREQVVITFPERYDQRTVRARPPVSLPVSLNARWPHLSLS